MRTLYRLADRGIFKKEDLQKTIIALKTNGRRASDIEASINQWLSQVPSHLFRSITFDCGKEFSNWKSISNAHDIKYSGLK